MTFNDNDNEIRQAAQRLVEAAEQDWPSLAQHRAGLFRAAAELKQLLATGENQPAKTVIPRMSTEVINRLAHQAGSEIHHTTIGWPDQAEEFVKLVTTVACSGRVLPTAQPDFEAVRDKRMSEMTPTQRDDALELWIRQNVGWMGCYHVPHYTFLLARLDASRANAGQPFAVPVEGGA